MDSSSLWTVQFPAAAALAALAAIGYLLSHARHGRSQFTVVDALSLILLMAIVAGAGVPMINAFTSNAKETSLLQNLYTLRSQIEMYKVQHGGDVPILYKATFPQMTQATNAQGIPGPAGSKHAYGPYFVGGIPKNPITGRNQITPTDVFPPKAASGGGGWLYCQQTGQVAADLPEYLSR